MMFDVKYEGSGFAKVVATNTMPFAIPFMVSFDETFDVRVDARAGVDDNDYQAPLRFTGKLNKLTIDLNPLNAADENLLKQRPGRRQRQCTSLRKGDPP